MAKLRAHSISMSVDGYAAGSNQTVDAPMGANGMSLHEWVFDCAAGQRMVGREPTAAPSVDDVFIERGTENIGATVMGRNMFGPIRGEWPDDEWKGWWGDNPPYHHQVFVLTNHPRHAFTMDGGTTFNFVADGIESALAQAFTAADGQDVRLGGGVSTIRQYLAAGLVDEMHVAVVPVVLGAGECLFADLDLPSLGYGVTKRVVSDPATHIVITKTA